MMLPAVLTVMVIFYLALLTITQGNNQGCDAKNCINETCHYEPAIPYCTYGCKPGFAGNLCKEICGNACFSCERNNIDRCTQCFNGYYGNRCEHQCMNCLNLTCAMNGSCTEGCEPPRWGETCEESCPPGCPDGCHPSFGNCTEQSTESYISTTITSSSTGCDSKNCINETCHYDQAIPFCTYGCKPGFAGNLCKEICGNACFSCERNNIDRCTQCFNGYYGNRCEHQCMNCLNLTCAMNGSCTEGCEPPRWGETCEESCPPGCPDGCHPSFGNCTEQSTESYISTTITSSSTDLPWILGICSSLVLGLIFGMLIFLKYRKKTPHEQDETKTEGQDNSPYDKPCSNDDEDPTDVYAELHEMAAYLSPLPQRASTEDDNSSYRCEIQSDVYLTPASIKDGTEMDDYLRPQSSSHYQSLSFKDGSDSKDNVYTGIQS